MHVRVCVADVGVWVGDTHTDVSVCRCVCVCGIYFRDVGVLTLDHVHRRLGVVCVSVCQYVSVCLCVCTHDP